MTTTLQFIVIQAKCSFYFSSKTIIVLHVLFQLNYNFLLHLGKLTFAFYLKWLKTNSELCCRYNVDIQRMSNEPNYDFMYFFSIQFPAQHQCSLSDSLFQLVHFKGIHLFPWNNLSVREHRLSGPFYGEVIPFFLTIIMYTLCLCQHKQKTM